MQLIIGGIDPSFTATGLAKGLYDTETGDLNVYALNLVTTEKDQGKQVRVNSDDLRRASILTVGIHQWIADCHVVMAEVPTGSQSAAAAKGLAIATGVLGSVGEVGAFKGKLIQVQPTENKKLFCGSKNASKDDMIEEAMRRWPKAGWRMRKLKGELVPLNENEHLADACGAIHAGLQTDQFRSLVQILRSLPTSSQ